MTDRKTRTPAVRRTDEVEKIVRTENTTTRSGQTTTVKTNGRMIVQTSFTMTDSRMKITTMNNQTMTGTTINLDPVPCSVRAWTRENGKKELRFARGFYSLEEEKSKDVTTTFCRTGRGQFHVSSMRTDKTLGARLHIAEHEATCKWTRQSGRSIGGNELRTTIPARRVPDVNGQSFSRGSAGRWCSRLRGWPRHTDAPRLRLTGHRTRTI